MKSRHPILKKDKGGHKMRVWHLGVALAVVVFFVLVWNKVAAIQTNKEATRTFPLPKKTILWRQEAEPIEFVLETTASQLGDYVCKGGQDIYRVPVQMLAISRDPTLELASVGNFLCARRKDGFAFSVVWPEGPSIVRWPRGAAGGEGFDWYLCPHMIGRAIATAKGDKAVDWLLRE